MAKSLQGFFENIGKSGYKNTKDILAAAINTLNPNLEQNTIVNLGKLGVDVAKLVGGDTSETNRARQVGQFYADRYGGMDKIANTLYEDPVGVALDASTILGGTGGILKGTGTLAKSSKLAKVGSMVDDVARVIDPINKITAPAGRVAAKTGELIKKGTEPARKSAASFLAGKSSKANPSQRANFKEITGKDINDFMVDNNVYSLDDATKAIDPLQESYNKMVRTDSPVNNVQYAQNLRQKAMDILDNDRSPSARQLAEKLWKEADVQEQMGGLTDTVLTNTKSNQFNKVPKGAMIDPMSDSFNKALGQVGIQSLDDISPGSSAVGKQLQAYRELEEILSKQAELGKGTQLFNLLKPSAAGILAGAGAGSFIPGMGNVAGGVIGGSAMALANSRMLQRNIAKALTGNSELIRLLSEAGGKGVQTTSNIARAGRMNQIEQEPMTGTVLSEKSQQTAQSPQLQQSYDPSIPQEQFDPNEQVTLLDGRTMSFGELQPMLQSGQVGGMQEQQSPYSPEQFQAMYLMDMLQNGGKNFEKIKMLETVLNPESDIDRQIKVAQLEKLRNPQQNVKQTETQAKFEAAGGAALHALNLLESGDISTGIGQDIVGGIGEKLGFNSDEQTDYRSTISQARTIARNALLGANMTEKELESISAFIPEFNDPPNVAKQKLRSFIREMDKLSKKEMVSDQVVKNNEFLNYLGVQ